MPARANTTAPASRARRFGGCLTTQLLPKLRPPAAGPASPPRRCARAFRYCARPGVKTGSEIALPVLLIAAAARSNGKKLQDGRREGPTNFTQHKPYTTG